MICLRYYHTFRIDLSCAICRRDITIDTPARPCLWTNRYDGHPYEEKSVKCRYCKADVVMFFYCEAGLEDEHDNAESLVISVTNIDKGSL